MTTTQQFFSKSFSGGAQNTRRSEGINPDAAGTTYNQTFAELKAGKSKPNVLTAEYYRKNGDPQNDTKIQRTWIVQDDPGMKVREYQEYNNALPSADNANSLPIGTGQYFKQQRSNTVGAYRRLRSDATTAPREHLLMNFR
jgi:hypothetical protein